MSCNFEKELLQEYLDKTIDPITSIVLEEHLKYCNECKKELTELKLLYWELEKEIVQIEIPEVLNQLRAEFIEQLTDEPAKNSVLRYQRIAFKKSKQFLDFMPGYTKTSKLINKGLEKAPSLVSKGIGNLVRRTIGLKPVRDRV